ncbi:MAG TPA: hypothetical protein VMZ29_06830 [Candidatus Bathyarchaeia archaeon]|nr:hypothetical protein [Candidatus Bathyarchaeia archaeon]
MSENSIRILSKEDVKKALPMKEAIILMKEAFTQLSLNQANVPPRIHLSIPEHNGDSLIMPIHMQSNERIGLKVITLFNENYKKKLPLIHALMIIFDATDGRPLALIEGSSLTALRTGASAGFATDLLARKDSEIVAIFGAGIQGQSQLEAMCTVRKIKKAIIFDVNKEKAELFTKNMKNKLSIDITIAETIKDLREADIVSTATNSSTPVFPDSELREGTHINAIGSYKPHIREIPTETIKRAIIIVDHLESCLMEAGDLIIPIDQGIITANHIFGELGKIILKGEFARESNKDITLFKSVGNAVQDLVTANHILIKAKKLDLGETMYL